jgi:hypothetical protein
MIVKWLIIIYNLQKTLLIYYQPLTTFLGWRIHTREKTDLYSLTEKAILLLVIF